MNDLIYNYEENSFYFLGSNITPTYNRFDILSEENQDNKSGSEYTPLFSEYIYDKNCPNFSSQNETNFSFDNIYSNVPCRVENTKYMYKK